MAQVRDVFWLNQPRVSTFAQNPVQNTLSRGCSGGATYAGEVYRHSGGAVESGLPRAGYGSVPWRCAEGFHREDCAWRVHISVEAGGLVSLAAANGGSCPSVDVAMITAAKVFGARTIGVLLSGMGSDGVEGMAAILRSNGVAYIQDPRTCTLAGMPGAAIERGLAGRVARPREIGRMLAHDGVRA